MTTCSHLANDLPAWIFTAPRHIKCPLCGAVGRRNATKGERAEFRRVGWVYLRPSFTCPTMETTLSTPRNPA